MDSAITVVTLTSLRPRTRENAFGEVIDDYIDADAAKKYRLDDESIANVVKQYDVITTPFGNLEKNHR